MAETMKKRINLDYDELLTAFWVWIWNIIDSDRRCYVSLDSARRAFFKAHNQPCERLIYEMAFLKDWNNVAVYFKKRWEVPESESAKIKGYKKAALYSAWLYIINV